MNQIAPEAHHGGTLPQAFDWRHKGLPAKAEGQTSEGLQALGMNILYGQCMMPVAILKESAIAANSRWMRQFLAETGVEICPHGKTTMSPELFRRQLEDGAWGLTAATASHVRIYRNFGVERVFLANQLVGDGNIGWILDELARDAHFDFYALVDSVEGVELLAQAASARGASRPLQLLVEVGAAGGRTGVRSHDVGMAVARAVHSAAPYLALVGVEAFEGIYPAQAGVGPAGSMLDRVVDLARDIEAEGLFTAGEILLTAGGSGFFDLCANRLRKVGLKRVRVVLRSRCYLIHDSGMYERLFREIKGRLGLGSGGLQPALEVWAVIQSAPEPGRVIAGLGKRDIGNDIDMPQALWWFRPRQHDRPHAIPSGYRVSTLYDQHAYLDGSPLFQVGDLVGFGVSHPCTTFDKWRMLFTVDDDYRISGAVSTWF